jgi:hypothetical protein
MCMSAIDARTSDAFSKIKPYLAFESTDAEKMKFFC